MAFNKENCPGNELILHIVWGGGDCWGTGGRNLKKEERGKYRRYLRGESTQRKTKGEGEDESQQDGCFKVFCLLATKSRQNDAVDENVIMPSLREEF